MREGFGDDIISSGGGKVGRVRGLGTNGKVGAGGGGGGGVGVGVGGGPYQMHHHPYTQAHRHAHGQHMTSTGKSLIYGSDGEGGLEGFQGNGNGNGVLVGVGRRRGGGRGGGGGKMGPPVERAWAEKWRVELKLASVSFLFLLHFYDSEIPLSDEEWCLLMIGVGVGGYSIFLQRQFHRLLEMLNLKNLDTGDKLAYRAFRLYVKERLFRFNFVSFPSLLSF